MAEDFETDEQIGYVLMAAEEDMKALVSKSKAATVVDCAVVCEVKCKFAFMWGLCESSSSHLRI